jgi:protocatechuate 3,4-dioxygenase alpha subunit
MPGETPSQTIGPFFHIGLEWQDGEQAMFGTPGERITLTGRITDGTGAPIDDAMIETWQMDAAGKPPAAGDVRPGGLARCYTDKDGRYRIRTVMPGAFSGPDSARYAPQLNVTLFMRGLLKAIRTRVFLASVEAVKDDPFARAIGDVNRLDTVIAQRDAAEPGVWSWDVRVQGERETAFIEF